MIGMCTALEQARWSVWDQPAMLLARNYVDAVQRARALVMMLPPDPAVVEDPDQVLDLIDGLVLTGGADIDPACYGQQAHAETVDTVPERDTFEIAMVRAAIERDMPVLGICRGMQLINVALGGTLIQHLPDSHGHGENTAVAGRLLRRRRSRCEGLGGRHAGGARGGGDRARDQVRPPSGHRSAGRGALTGERLCAIDGRRPARRPDRAGWDPIRPASCSACSGTPEADLESSRGDRRLVQAAVVQAARVEVAASASSPVRAEVARWRRRPESDMRR